MLRSTPIPRQKSPAGAKGQIARLAAPAFVGAAVGGILALVGLDATTLNIVIAAAGVGTAGALRLVFRRPQHYVSLAYVVNWSLLLGASLAATFILAGRT
jgi:hypothetical protein